MLKNLYHYHQERFSIIPWWILTLIIHLYSLTSLSDWTISHFMFLLISMFYLRILDDVMCLKMDQLKQKKRDYFKYIDELKNYKNFSLFLVIGMSIYILKDRAFYIYLSSIGLMILSYKFFETKTIVEYISLIKYPVLILVTQLVYNGQIDIWPFLFLFIFITTEYIDLNTKNKKKAKIIQILAILILFIIKMVTTMRLI